MFTLIKIIFSLERKNKHFLKKKKISPLVKNKVKVSDVTMCNQVVSLTGNLDRNSH